ncbi:MAG: hypothetical protein IJ503_08500 [Akkermansia sp.]|nr:hypothetical protein [Akkermansia sp.]MBQ8900894.1 hypothetical protein [Akkermansia sp.]
MPKIEESAIWAEMQKEKPFVTMFAFSWQPINGQGVDLRVTPHGVTVSVSRRVNRRKRGVRLTPSVLYSASGDPTYSFGLADVFDSYFDFLHFLTDEARIQEWDEWLRSRSDEESDDDDFDWEMDDVSDVVHWDLRLYSPLHEEHISFSDETKGEFPPGFDELLSVVNEWLELIGIPITLC